MHPSIKQVLDIYGLRAQKHLSQNFILNSAILQSISSLITHTDERSLIVEIGPGPGSLTRSILKKAPHSQVLAVELDRRFQPALEVHIAVVYFLLKMFSKSKKYTRIALNQFSEML